MPFTTRDGVRLHWDEQGEGTPVLLVMGAAWSSRMWFPAIPALAAHHRVVWFDNRGTGQSEASAVHPIASMADDALAVLDAAGIDSAHVYGASLGGVVVQQLALQAPARVRSLVLGCTGILSPDKPRMPRWLSRVLLSVPPAVRGKVLGSGYGPVCPPEARAAAEAVLAEEQPSKVALLAQQDALRVYSITREQVAGLAVPALVLHGTHDKRVKPAWGKELADTLPNARLVTYEGAAHNFVAEVTDQANQDVLDFFAEVDSAVRA